MFSKLWMFCNTVRPGRGRLWACHPLETWWSRTSPWSLRPPPDMRGVEVEARLKTFWFSHRFTWELSFPFSFFVPLYLCTLFCTYSIVLILFPFIYTLYSILFILYLSILFCIFYSSSILFPPMVGLGMGSIRSTIKAALVNENLQSNVSLCVSLCVSPGSPGNLKGSEGVKEW